MTHVQEIPEEGVRITYGARCAMRDDVELVSDIYEPLESGSYPILLMRQPYGRDIASTVVYAQPTWFCRQGFVVVIQDVRGRGDSQGQFIAFENEATDGLDTLDWVTQLPNTNGNVCMYGFSYQASTQLLLAGKKPDALKAIAPHMTAWDLYSGWFYRDGLLQLAGTIGWGTQMMREDAKRDSRTRLYRRLEEVWSGEEKIIHRLPINKISPLTDPSANGYVKSWLENDRYNPYWENLDMLSQASEIADIPCFHLGGWYDYYLRGTMDGYKACFAACPEKQKLVVGPWVHIPWGNVVGGKNLGREAMYDVDTELAAWLKYWANGSTEEDVTNIEISGVKYFSMGDLQWHTSSQWPPDHAEKVQFLLSSEGHANSIFGDGQLVQGENTVGAVADRYNYDPEVPVTAPGYNGSAVGWGPSNIYISQQGNNMLVYQTEVFEGTRRFGGQPSLKVYFKSTAEVTSLVCRLSVLRAPGVSEFISLGAVVSDPSESCNSNIVLLSILLDDCAFSVMPGERIIIDIASSAYPLLARHPNTYESPNSVSGPEKFVRAMQTVYHDADHPALFCLNEIKDLDE